MASKRYLAVRTTETIVPPERTDRHRRAFGNSEEAIHRWASGSQPDGYSRNVRFDDGVVYSYGRHFPMARHVRLPDGSAAVFLTTARYSVTTAKHIGEVRSAVRHLTVFEVPDVAADARWQHVHNLDHYRAEMATAIDKATRAREYKGGHLRAAVDARLAGNRYAQAVGLKERIDPPRSKPFGVEPGEDFAAWSARILALAEDLDATRNAARNARREKQRKAEEERLAPPVAAYRERAAAYLAGTGEYPNDPPVWGMPETAEVEAKRWAGELAAWRAGGPLPDMPYHGYAYGHGQLAYLRVRGRVLETSLRVAVPVRAALPILAAVRGEVTLPEGFGVDGFRLSSIDRDARTVRIGCHTLSFDEIELAGAAAGYPPGTPIPLPPIAPREGDGGYKTATAEVAPEPATA